MLPEVFVPGFKPAFDLRLHGCRDAGPAGLGERLQPGRHVDAVAEQVVALDHDVAQIDADAEAHAVLLAKVRVETP